MRERFLAIGALLGSVRDVVAERVHGPTPPSWADRRGWSEALLAMDDGTLERAEHGDIARVLAGAPELPPSLRELAGGVVASTALATPAPPGDVRPLRRASERKRVQVAALAALVRAWAPRARRVIDLGAGHGHLTRELADALDLPAIGVELRGHVVDNARALTASSRVRFVEHDALGVPLDVREDDLLVGLHACGSLGDALIRAAADTGAGALLISCCPQKIPTDVRAPVSALGQRLELAFERDQLGLANLATLAQGGFESGGVNERRHARYTLWLLLREAGVELAHGDEIAGIHRRQLRRPLEELAARAFALRDRPPPPADAVARAAERARAEHARARRLALPRAMLARPLELALVLDRAALLAERGAAADVVEAFERSASPRNLAIVRRPADPAAVRRGTTT